MKVRVLLSLLAAALVWLVATPARAAAPQCDARGAITFAPPPTLEEPNASVDVAEPKDDCTAHGDDFVLRRGERSSRSAEATDAMAKLLLVTAASVAIAFAGGELPRSSTRPLASRTDRDRLDRPPR